MVDIERMVKFRCREVRGAVGGSVRVNLGPIVCAWMRNRVNRGASASQRREHRLSLLFDAICTIQRNFSSGVATASTSSKFLPYPHSLRVSHCELWSRILDMKWGSGSACTEELM